MSTWNSVTICFIGGGNMARSMIGGLRSQGLPGEFINVSEPDLDLRLALAKEFDVAVWSNNDEAATNADLIVLAVKPQVMKAVCAGLAPLLRKQRSLIVSIAAGITTVQIEQWLERKQSVVRAMPNTPAMMGAGASGLYANAEVDAAQRDLAQQLLGAIGSTAWIEREELMDTVTALSGSGPAYFFLLIELLEDAAVAQGLPRPVARALIIQTCFGAARMAKEEGATPALLRERVTSPGGTTAAALHVFETEGLRALVARAVAAATARGIELSAHSGK